LLRCAAGVDAVRALTKLLLLELTRTVRWRDSWGSTPSV
jgi:hypothetical protein